MAADPKQQHATSLIPPRKAMFSAANHPATDWSSVNGTVRHSWQSKWAGGTVGAHDIDFVSGDALVRMPSLQLLFSWNGGCAEADAQSGKKLWSYKNRPSYAIVLPPGSSVEFRIKEKSKYQFLSIELEQHFLSRVTECTDMAACEILETWNYHDPFIWQLARNIYSEGAIDGASGLLYMETATTLLSLHILRAFSAAKASAPLIPRGGLSGNVLRRACEYMMSRLEEDITLQEVSAVTGLSLGHFSVAFRKSVGMTPHAWLRRHRITKAKTLLNDPTFDLTSIAIAVGYANQSSFGVAFKREVGLPPQQWRRDLY